MTYGRRNTMRRIAAVILLLFILLLPVQNILTAPAVSVAQAQATNNMCAGTTSDCLGGIIYLFAVYIPTQFAYATGYLFNFSLQLALNSAAYALDFLSLGWTVVRDIANLTFIFILIYIAYTVIVRAETSGTMRMLAWVVTMALLINFSFFITRIVIDAGNILAVQFYNAIPIAPSTPSPLGSTPSKPVFIKDLTAGIMDAVKVQGILSDSSFQAFRDDKNYGKNMAPGFWDNLGILALTFISIGIFLSLLGFIFLIVGIKFIVRVVILWLTIIASPLAFAARALPSNKKTMEYYGMWKDNLIQSSFYPSIFLFLFFIMTLFLQALAGDKGLVPSIFAQANSLNQAGPNSESAVRGVISVIANVAIRMGMVTVLLYFAMKASDAFSSMGSGLANSITSWTGGVVSGAASRAARAGISTTAFAGRNTVGRAADAASRSQLIQNFAARSIWGRPVKAALEGAAKGSYDVRGVPGVKSTLESVNKIPGAKSSGLNFNLGKAGSDNIRKQFDRRAKNIEERAKEMKSSSPVDIQNAIPESVKILEKRKEEFAQKESQAEGLLKEARSLGAAADIARIEQELRGVRANIKQADETLGDQSKLRGFTSDRLKALDADRLKRFQERIREPSLANLDNPSPGSIAGAAKIDPLIKGKSAHDELLEAAEKVRKEHEAEHAAEHKEEAHVPHTPERKEEKAEAKPKDESHGDGDHGHGPTNHGLYFKGIRAATGTYGSNKAAEAEVSEEIAQQLKRLNLRMNDVQKNTAAQGTQMAGVQESLDTLKRTSQQPPAQSGPTTFGKNSEGPGAVRPTANTREVGGVDEGRNRRIPEDKGGRGTNASINELADSATNKPPTDDTSTPPATS